MAQKQGFDLEESIRRYTAHITSSIVSHRKKEAAAKEFAGHIEDAVYEKMLRGFSEKDAFQAACEELGDPTKIGELLACVHNKDPLPSFVRWLIFLGVGAGIALAYFLIENTSFRAWIILFVQLTLIGFGIFAAVALYRTLHCLRARRNTLRKIEAFAVTHGLRYGFIANGYNGVFRPTDKPQMWVETPKGERNILSMWGTFWGKRHLHLTDIGLYTYTKIFGYAMIPTKVFAFFGAAFFTAVPKGLQYFSYTHTEIHDSLPKGVHLLPKVDWEMGEVVGKKNVRILLLSPVPFKASSLENGREHELMDGDRFTDATVYSTVGFLSYLNGERIASGGSFFDDRTK